MNTLNPLLVVVCLLLAMAVLSYDCEANPVKYCKNFETGDIIVIEAGYPCPSPTVEI